MSTQKTVAPCSGGCPVNTDVGGYLDAITRGEYTEAFRIIADRNPFPSVCAWVCPHPCEDRCRRGGVDHPLNIRALKRFAVERAGQPEDETVPDEFPAGHCADAELTATGSPDLPGGDVAVVGAGPAGLAAALDLSSRGFSVTVLDRLAGPGGHFYASLPLYRLPRRVVRQDVRRIEEKGVKIICGVEVGRNVTMDQLRSMYRAVIIATGLPQSRNLPVKGFDHPSVLLALPFLQGANLGRPLPVGRRVLVIGGGDVAMDVARTAVRQGAERVEVACLERGKEMPAHSWEVEEALEEGVMIADGWGPEEALIQDGVLTGLRVKKVISVFDSQGRFNPSFDEADRRTLEAGTIIVAVGQKADLGLLEGGAVSMVDRGNLRVDRETMATPEEGVFACGEVATGPGAAISAVASGQKAAGSVERYLTKGGLPGSTLKVSVIEPLPEEVARRVVNRARQPVPVVEAPERMHSFLPFEKGYDESRARQESARCMRCGLGAVVIEEKCAACLTCARLCPFGVPRVDGRAEISLQKCQGCGVCAAVCPAGAIEMAGPSCGGGLPGLNSEGEGPKAGGIDPEDGHPVVIYLCRYVVGGDLEPDFNRRTPDLSGARVRVLPSADSLETRRVLEDLERGARGVALVACGGADCLAGGYRCSCHEFAAAGRIAREIGVNPGRLRLLKAGSDQPLDGALSAFAKEARELDLRR